MSTAARILAALAKKPALYSELARLASDSGDLAASLRGLLLTGKIVNLGSNYALR